MHLHRVAHEVISDERRRQLWRRVNVAWHLREEADPLGQIRCVTSPAGQTFYELLNTLGDERVVFFQRSGTQRAVPRLASPRVLHGVTMCDKR